MNCAAWPQLLTALGAGDPGVGHGSSPSGLRIALGLATLVALALLGSHRRWWSWRRSPLGAALSTGGWLMVGLGLLLGPHVIGLIDEGYVDALRPLVLFCLGWVGMMVGLQLRRDLPKLLPRGAWPLAWADALGGFLIVALGVGLALGLMVWQINQSGHIDYLAIVSIAILLSACSVGWSSEMRSIGGNDPQLAPAANLLRAASGLGGVLTVLLYGLALMLVHHRDQGEFAAWPIMAGLGLSLCLAMIAGRLASWMMSIGGRNESQFLVVLLGLVSFVAGAAATMGYSAVFVAMLCGMVVVNLPGNLIKRFGRVIVDAEQPIAMILMLTAGVLADPALGRVGWLVVVVLVMVRFAFKLRLSNSFLASVEAPRAERLRFVTVRQAPLAVALAVGFAVGNHDRITESVLSGGQLIMIMIAVGLISEAAAQLHRWANSSKRSRPSPQAEASD